MNPFEKAIRGALEKGNAEDRAFREKVYRSVHAALERALQSNPDVAEATARQRRDALKATISTIESEFIPATAPVVEPVMALEDENDPMLAPTLEASDRPQDAASAADDAPQIDAPRREPGPSRGEGEVPIDPDTRAEPRGTTPGMPRIVPGMRAGATDGRDRGADVAGGPEAAAPYSEPAAERRPERRRGRGRAYAAIFAGVTAAAFVALGVWWSVQQGLFESPAERDTSVPNPPTSLPDEDFEPAERPAAGPGTAAQTTWIDIFTPADPSSVRAPSDTTVDVIDDDDGPLLRIRSADADAAVLFDVGQGVLDQIAGRRALFNIVARAEDGKEAQISVTCNFGELGDCGRQRYNVGQTRTDHLFDLALPDRRAGAAGTIAIISDIEGAGKAIEIESIRVSIAE